MPEYTNTLDPDADKLLKIEAKKRHRQPADQATVYVLIALGQWQESDGPVGPAAPAETPPTHRVPVLTSSDAHGTMVE